MINRTSLLQRPTLVLAAATALALGIGCGGGGDDTGEPSATAKPASSGGLESTPELLAYYTDIGKIFDTANTQSDELSASFDEQYSAATSVEEARDTLLSYLSDSTNVNSKALDEMRGVDPPDEVKDKHQAFLDAGDNLLNVARELTQRLQDVNTEEEFNAVSDEFNTKGSEAAQAADSACADLQGVADDARIEVDLKCQG